MPEMSDTEKCTDAPVPEDLKTMHQRLVAFRLGGLAYILGSLDAIRLIERIGRAESSLSRAVMERDQLNKDFEATLLDRNELLAHYQRVTAERDQLRVERDAAREALLASERLRANKYMEWGYAGGPNECEHGFAEGIDCPRCDEKVVWDYFGGKSVATPLGTPGSTKEDK